MKLYYGKGACSLSPHIALREAGLAFELERVDLATKQTEAGVDFTRVNPKGYVPALVLDDGQVLTEGTAVVQYIADQRPESGLAPPAGTLARYRLQEWLNFISTEVHKQYSPLFNQKIPDEWRQTALGNLRRRFGYLAEQLQDRPYLMGEQFTVADAYLFVVLRWSPFVSVDLGEWPVLRDYVERVAARPRVQEALKAEGIIR